MKNLTIKYNELPETILGFYTKIDEYEYIVLNDKTQLENQTLAYWCCMYYKKQGSHVGKVTISDIERENFEPMQYAKAKLQIMLGA